VPLKSSSGSPLRNFLSGFTHCFIGGLDQSICGHFPSWARFDPEEYHCFHVYKASRRRSFPPYSPLFPFGRPIYTTLIPSLFLSPSHHEPPLQEPNGTSRRHLCCAGPDIHFIRWHKATPTPTWSAAKLSTTGRPSNRTPKHRMTHRTADRGALLSTTVCLKNGTRPNTCLPSDSLHLQMAMHDICPRYAYFQLLVCSSP
jgi:hypothetical protein